MKPEHDPKNNDPLFLLRQELESIREVVFAQVNKMTKNSNTYADDIYQTVVQQLLESASRGMIPEHKSWIPLAKIIAKRRLIDVFRGQGRDHSSNTQFVINNTSVHEDFDESSSHLTRALFDAMALLPAESQELLRLRYLTGLRLRQISELTGKSISTVYSSIDGAIKKVRIQLENQAIDDKLLREILDQEWPTEI